MTINIISEEFMCLNVGLNFAGMSINNYKCFREPLYANTQGIVLKGFVHQVSLAKQL
ncbi:MAG: hypothetical protein LBG59_01225 [Candidatus Peribacteria bacterium]|nr:hypothetical protein [Candidatus Peribacteria bacterium]